MRTLSFRKSMSSNLGTIKMGGDITKLLSKATQLTQTGDAQNRNTGFDRS